MMVVIAAKLQQLSKMWLKSAAVAEVAAEMVTMMMVMIVSFVNLEILLLIFHHHLHYQLIQRQTQT